MPDFDKIIRTKGVCLIWVMKLIVYLDTAILVSYIVNGFVLWLPGKLLHIKTKIYRRMLGATLGVLYSGLCFMLNFYQLWLSVCVAYLQIVVVYPKKHLALFGTYLLTAITLAGWQQLFSLKGIFSLMLFGAGGFVGLTVAQKAVLYIRTSKMYRKVNIRVGERNVEFSGYIDSGNRLSVAVVDEDTAVRLIGEDCVADMKKYRQSETVRYRFLPCTTVSGEGLIPVFKPDEFEIEGIKSDMQIGVNFMPMHEKMLLPKSVLEVL